MKDPVPARVRKVDTVEDTLLILNMIKEKKRQEREETKVFENKRDKIIGK